MSVVAVGTMASYCNKWSSSSEVVTTHHSPPMSLPQLIVPEAEKRDSSCSRLKKLTKVDENNNSYLS
eukprot:SM000061S19226  [mRNA]  locus=s61:275848:276380:+ [translate_table: standard]